MDPMMLANRSRFLVATTNAGKLKELRQLVGGAVDVVSLMDLPPIPEPMEDGATFEANAEKKARAYAQASGLPTLADDSGLCVDALDGRPGLYSARYAPGDDTARNVKLLGELAEVPEARRTASYVCALCLVLPSGGMRTARGICHGRILEEPRGAHGFAYDPLFFLPSLGKTMAELSTEGRAAVSHRGKAVREILPVLMAAMPLRRDK
jgi:XTP/dITP diphosphohydrolase